MPILLYLGTNNNYCFDSDSYIQIVLIFQFNKFYTEHCLNVAARQMNSFVLKIKVQNSQLPSYIIVALISRYISSTDPHFTTGLQVMVNMQPLRNVICRLGLGKLLSKYITVQWSLSFECLQAVPHTLLQTSRYMQHVKLVGHVLDIFFGLKSNSPASQLHTSCRSDTHQTINCSNSEIPQHWFTPVETFLILKHWWKERLHQDIKGHT